MRKQMEEALKTLLEWDREQLQKEILINQWSILRHLKDMVHPVIWPLERLREHRLERAHLVHELSLLLLPFSQRTVPWTGRGLPPEEEQRGQMREALRLIATEPPMQQSAIQMENEEGGKIPPPKEEKKCDVKGCFSHDPPSSPEPGQAIPICNLGEIMNVQTEEEKEK
jgi:hypothetical protein